MAGSWLSVTIFAAAQGRVSCDLVVKRGGTQEDPPVFAYPPSDTVGRAAYALARLREPQKGPTICARPDQWNTG